MKFKITNHVTLPILKFGVEPKYLRFDAPAHVGKVVDDKKEPPTMARVTDMETGEVGEIILGLVLKENLFDAYPDDSYVGKIFRIAKNAPEGARKYALWEVLEVELEDDAPEATSEATSKANKGKSAA
jgi:hypothetical protein